MIIITTEDGETYYVKTPALDTQAQELFNSITEKYCDAKYRAISVELDPGEHHTKAISISCENIKRIWRE